MIGAQIGMKAYLVKFGGGGREIVIVAYDAVKLMEYLGEAGVGRAKQLISLEEMDAEGRAVI